MSTRSLKPYLLCRYAAESSLYNTWIDQLPMGYEIVTQCPTDFAPSEDCGIVITHEHYRWEETSALRRIQKSESVPTLVLADGVLEYRNTWQNPTIPDGSLYQPLLADKIACIGKQSASMIESWGNHGKTEIVGLPRLDSLLQQTSEAQLNSSGPFRLLIATANTPAFTDDQFSTVAKSLKAVEKVLAKQATIAGRELQIVWRLTAGLENEIEFKAPEPSTSLKPLSDEIRGCDAVLTTPSTTILESMLIGKPTAVLDFSNSPQFVASAWNIFSVDHIESVLNELANPPVAKMIFQDFVLHDNLQCEEPATNRMVKLVTEMIGSYEKQRNDHVGVRFPNRILESPQSELPQRGLADKSELLKSRLFPENAAFEKQQLAELQSELSQAIHRLGTVPRELADKNNQIAQLQDALDESRRRVADVRSRLFKLRKILGIGKENQGED